MRITLFIALMLALAGCNPEGSMLASDVNSILTENGLSGAPLDCSMLGYGFGRTRDGRCLLPLDASTTNSLVSSLALQPPDPRLPTTAPGACAALSTFGAASRTVVYWLGGRDPQLRLGNGGQFEYFALYFNPDENRGCVQVSYAYG